MKILTVWSFLSRDAKPPTRVPFNILLLLMGSHSTECLLTPVLSALFVPGVCPFCPCRSERMDGEKMSKSWVWNIPVRFSMGPLCWWDTFPSPQSYACSHEIQETRYKPNLRISCPPSLWSALVGVAAIELQANAKEVCRSELFPLSFLGFWVLNCKNVQNCICFLLKMLALAICACNLVWVYKRLMFFPGFFQDQEPVPGFWLWK